MASRSAWIDFVISSKTKFFILERFKLKIGALRDDSQYSTISLAICSGVLVI